MSNLSVVSASPSRCGSTLPSPTRVPSPKQWQESVFESNFRPVPIEVNTRRAASAPPVNFQSLTFLEKLMYTGKQSPASVAKTAGSPGKTTAGTSTFKLEVLSPQKQKKQVTYGHESTYLMTPSSDHVQAFRSGMEQMPPLKIIRHVKVGVKLPKMSSGNTSSNICRNHAGGFYATS